VVHGRDDGSQVGDAMRKIKCCLFENLDKIVNTSKTNKSEGLLTFKTSRSSAAMSHSADTSSCLRRSNSRTAVIASMATRYWTAKSSMSKVEFQQVATPRGIMRRGRPWRESVLFHAGRRMVVEFLSENAIFRSYTVHVCQLRIMV